MLTSLSAQICYGAVEDSTATYNSEGIIVSDTNLDGSDLFGSSFSEVCSPISYIGVCSDCSILGVEMPSLELEREIRLVFHFPTDDPNGTYTKQGGLVNNEWDADYVAYQTVSWMNNLMADLMTHPGNGNNPQFVGDSKIRFKIVPSSAPRDNGVYLYSGRRPVNIEDRNVINVIIEKANASGPNPFIGGILYNGIRGSEMTLRDVTGRNVWRAGSLFFPEDLGPIVLHEAGHIYGLGHSYCLDEQFNPCINVDLDILLECNVDVEPTSHSCSGRLGNITSCVPWDSPSRNIMGNNLSNRTFSPCQLEQWKQNMFANHYHYFDYASSLSGIPSVVTLPANEITIIEQTTLGLSDIVVPATATLLLKGELRMADGKTIEIKRGGKMIVDGGTIGGIQRRGRVNNVATPINAIWGSIYVEGNRDRQQPNGYADVSNYQGQDLLNAGVLILQDACIQHTRTAISTSKKGAHWNDAYYGGLIQSRRSSFNNVSRAVEFMRYRIQNKSFFENTTFVSGSEHASSVGVSIWACYPIRFHACSFNGFRTAAIRGVDFGADIANGTTFNRNRYGIEVGKTLPIAGHSIHVGPSLSVIEHINSQVVSDFIPTSAVSGNTFNTLSTAQSREDENATAHIYVESVFELTGMRVKENDLRGADYGIYMNGKSRVDIVDNDINAVYAPFHLQYINTDIGDPSQIVCNRTVSSNSAGKYSFVQNMDMAEIKYNVFDGGALSTTGTKLWVDGLLSLPQGAPDDPARNCFRSFVGLKGGDPSILYFVKDDSPGHRDLPNSPTCVLTPNYNSPNYEGFFDYTESLSNFDASGCDRISTIHDPTTSKDSLIDKIGRFYEVQQELDNDSTNLSLQLKLAELATEKSDLWAVYVQYLIDGIDSTALIGAYSLEDKRGVHLSLTGALYKMEAYETANSQLLTNNTALTEEDKAVFATYYDIFVNKKGGKELITAKHRFGLSPQSSYYRSMYMLLTEESHNLLLPEAKVEDEGKLLRTAVKEESLVIKVQNPVREQLLLSLPRSINIDVVPQDITYHIYDLSGKQCLSGILPAYSNQHRIDVSRLASGAYILALPGIHQQFKIIKL